MMKPLLGAPRASRSLLLGATATLGLTGLAVAIGSHGVRPQALRDGRRDTELVVTSARDAGPGTLRDAVLAADRLSSRCHILIKVARIDIESPLPALINPHGIELEATGDAGTIDAARETTGPALEIKSPGSVLTGLRVLRAHGYGILVDSPGAELTSVTVSDSKVGIMLGASASGTIIRTSILEHDETGLMAEPDVRHITLASDIFRLNTRAGLWFVGAAKGRPGSPGDSAEDPLIRVLDTVFEKNATGVVVANEATLVHKGRFIDNQTALNVLGGVARIEDSEIRGSERDAVSVSSGRFVVLTQSTLVDNKATALIVRDSDIRIEANTFARNGLALVLIGGGSGFTPLVRSNRITDNRGDGITLIGGAAALQGNQLIGNRGAGLRPLDLVQGHDDLKADPRLSGNVFHANGLEIAPTGVYRLSGAS